MKTIRGMIEARFPGLYADIASALVEAEAQYNRKSGQPPSQFLLEHTLRTAAIANKIAAMERVDPFLPVLIALFHDAGKFHEGEYHQDGLPEEEHAARLAERMLGGHGAQAGETAIVLEALRALYDERFPCVGPCRIVQDADRLEKLGPLGVGEFFTKATLRGRGLVEALAQTLSRELTYAKAAPRSMFTAAGRQLAAEQGAKTIGFFDDLTAQLDDWGIASFKRETVMLDEEFRTRDGVMVRGMEVIVAMHSACPDCGAALALSHRREPGVKCERFVAHIKCTSCAYSSKTSLCLPVLA